LESAPYGRSRQSFRLRGKSSRPLGAGLKGKIDAVLQNDLPSHLDRNWVYGKDMELHFIPFFQLAHLTVQNPRKEGKPPSEIDEGVNQRGFKAKGNPDLLFGDDLDRSPGGKVYPLQFFREAIGADHPRGKRFLATIDTPGGLELPLLQEFVEGMNTIEFFGLLRIEIHRCDISVFQYLEP